MQVAYSLPSGERLNLLPGIPESHLQYKVDGLESWHCNGEFGSLFQQHIQSRYGMYRRVVVRWRKPVKLVCRHAHPHSLFSRIVRSKPLHEFIKGFGEVHYDRDHLFATLSNNWCTALIPMKAGDHHYIELVCTRECLRDSLLPDEYLSVLMKQECETFPHRLHGPPFTVNFHIEKLITDMEYVDYTSDARAEYLDNQLKRYVRLVVDEIREQRTIRTKFRMEDWHRVQNAKTLIETDLELQLSTPQLSKTVGMNEHKLKKLFQQATGFAIDQYRKYCLCALVARKIVYTPDEPLKSFYSQAGYSNLANFIKGFRKLLCCTPGELRSDDWDLDVLPSKKLKNATAEIE